MEENETDSSSSSSESEFEEYSAPIEYSSAAVNKTIMKRPKQRQRPSTTGYKADHAARGMSAEQRKHHNDNEKRRRVELKMEFVAIRMELVDAAAPGVNENAPRKATLYGATTYIESMVRKAEADKKDIENMVKENERLRSIVNQYEGRRKKQKAMKGMTPEEKRNFRLSQMAHKI